MSQNLRIIIYSIFYTIEQVQGAVFEPPRMCIFHNTKLHTLFYPNTR